MGRRRRIQLKLTGDNALSGMQHLTALPPEISTLTHLTDLDLSYTQVSDIAPLRGMTGLQTLDLAGTQSSDITPLRGMTGLQLLSLSGSQVSDITPLRGMTELRAILLGRLPIKDLSVIADIPTIWNISLRGTQVTDLRPLLKLSKLKGLYFEETPFAAATEKLTALAQLGADNKPDECAEQTIAYLKTLPPWPDPLPWEVKDQTSDRDDPLKEPNQETALPLTLSEGNKVRVISPTPVGEEAHDPIKEAVLDELLSLINDLIRVAGNRHDDIYRGAQALKARIDKPLADIEMLKAHMAIEGLKRILSNKASRTGYDILDSGCVTALQSVIETGPTLTLDNPQVNVFIERQTRNQL